MRSSYRTLKLPHVSLKHNRQKDATPTHRHLLAQKVAIDCIHALNNEQLQQLDKVLDEIVKNPNYQQIKI